MTNSRSVSLAPAYPAIGRLLSLTSLASFSLYLCAYVGQPAPKIAA